MMAYKIGIVDLRKNLRPQYTTDLIQVIILPKNFFGAFTELSFYFKKVCNRLPITVGSATNLKLLKEATDLSNVPNNTGIDILE